MQRGLSALDVTRLSSSYTDKPFRSRYHEDFFELEKLGRGGYGSVYKVQNVFDGMFYALKKIQFKNSSVNLLEKVLREVKTLALLHHPNIVRYHTAWLEEDNTLSPDIHDENDSTMHTNESLSVSGETDSATDDMDQFNPFKYDENWDSLPQQRASRQEQHNTYNRNLINGQITNPLKISQRLPPSKYSKRSPSPLSKPSNTVNITTLFIVMQLYSTTLSQWLDVRPNVDARHNIQIFRQICKGLQYIHSRGVIHRDLKPGNIFLSHANDSTQEFVVCLGDFGLAILTGQTSPTHSPVAPGIFPQSTSPSSSIDGVNSAITLGTSPTPLSSSSCPSMASSFCSLSSGLGRSWEAKKHTTAVGTLTYSSPEQRQGVYNEKTDIFSLGIIFFELYYTSSTKMEKARVLSDLRKRILPPAFLQKYPTESAFVMWLMSPNPDDRPSVDEILTHHLLADEYVSVPRREIIDLETAMKKQQEKILQQEQYIMMLERKLGDLCEGTESSTRRLQEVPAVDAMCV